MIAALSIIILVVLFNYILAKYTGNWDAPDETVKPEPDAAREILAEQEETQMAGLEDSANPDSIYRKTLRSLHKVDLNKVEPGQQAKPVNADQYYRQVLREHHQKHK